MYFYHKVNTQQMEHHQLSSSYIIFICFFKDQKTHHVNQLENLPLSRKQILKNIFLWQSGFTHILRVMEYRITSSMFEKSWNSVLVMNFIKKSCKLGKILCQQKCDNPYILFNSLPIQDTQPDIVSSLSGRASVFCFWTISRKSVFHFLTISCKPFKLTLLL